MTKRGRVAVGVGIAIGVGCLYWWLFGLQTYYLIEARRLARETPSVMVTPSELADLSISPALGRKLSYFGYEFEVPWNDLDQVKTKGIEGLNVVTISLRSGNVISFSSASVRGLDYAFTRAMLEVTPLRFSLVMPKRRAVQEGVLLMTKAATAAHDAELGIYAVKTREFEGFQYGRPQNPPKPLRTELFAKDAHLKILFGQKPNGPTMITQPDINRIVQSIHKLPTDEAGAKPGI